MSLINNTITFSTTFTSTTTSNYLVVANWNAPANGSSLNIDLYGQDITATDSEGSHNFFGKVKRIQHNRNNKGGGARMVFFTPAPEGDGIRTGGAPGGGEQIGGDPDFFWPTTDTGSWTNGNNAYDKIDGTYATQSSDGEIHNFGNYGFNVPAQNGISGIEVRLEISATAASGDIDVELSWDGGSSWTDAKTTETLTTIDRVLEVGSPSDLWGRVWSQEEFSNINFMVRLTSNNQAETIQIDAIKVKVYHQTSGGSSGGGGQVGFF